MRIPRRYSALLPACLLPVAGAFAQAPGDGRPRLALPAAQRTHTALAFEDALTGPALTATTGDLHLRLLVARAARDTALVRSTLRLAEEAYARLGPRNAPPPVLLAETDAWLGDTAAAIGRLMTFESRRKAMDVTVRWADVPNGALLARTDTVRARLAGQVALPGNGATVILPRRSQGAWRWRYDAEIRTRLPFAMPTDTAVPVARLALIIDEVVTPSSAGLALRTTVHGAAFDLPVLERLGDEGLLFLRSLLASLRTGSVTAVVGNDGRVSERQVADGTGSRTVAAASLLLAMGPLAFAPRLPTDTLAVGTAWTDTVRFAAPGTALGDAPIPLPATLRLSQVRDHEGRRLAVIAVDADVRDLPLGTGVERADIALSGEFVLDVADGLPVRTAASLRAWVRDGRGARIPVRALVTALRQTAPASGGQIASR